MYGNVLTKNTPQSVSPRPSKMSSFASPPRGASPAGGGAETRRFTVFPDDAAKRYDLVVGAGVLQDVVSFFFLVLSLSLLSLLGVPRAQVSSEETPHLSSEETPQQGASATPKSLRGVPKTARLLVLFLSGGDGSIL